MIELELSQIWNRLHRFAIFMALCLGLALGAAVRAEDSQIYIDVGQAQVKKSLLALPSLQYLGTQPANASHLQLGQNLFQVIYNDLSVSNYFVFIKPEAFLEDPNKVGLRPAPGDPGGFNFQSWKTIGTEFLIRAAYNVIGNDLTLETYVYHVPTARLVLGKIYRGTLSGARRVAHTFADDVVKALTGKKGMFLTRLVATRQENKAGEITKAGVIKEIYILDWDGANQTRITAHQSIALSPTWSNSGTKIAYTAFAYHRAQKMRNADLFVFDIPTGKRFMVSYRKGLNSGAAFLPGDNSLLLTLSRDESPDIYKMSADGTTLSPLTHGPNRAMNVEPAISPDGKTVAFASDRLGRPMIFTMSIGGGDIRRLTYAGKYNASPAWSPDGKTLAFAGQDGDHFDIFTMTPEGKNMKRLTDARKPNGKPANNESPSWSPDGRFIVFSSDRTGINQLYIVSPDGTNERRITNDQYNWEKPKWSPYLD